MEEQRIVWADVATFGVIAAVAAIFGFSHIDATVTWIGRAVGVVSIGWIALTLTLNRRSV